MPTTKLGLGDMQNMLSGSVASSAAQKVAMQQASIPRLTTTERDALAAADRPEGYMIYNLTTHKYNFRAAAAWEAITSA